MKEYYFFIALACVLSMYFTNIARYFLVIGIILYSFYRNRQICIIVIVVEIFCLGYFKPASIEPCNGKIVRIMEIKENYVVAYNDNQAVILYNMHDVNYDDVYQLKGEYQLIDSTNNPNVFNFKQWANQKKYFYSMSVKEATLLKKGDSIKSKIYAKCRDSSLSSWYQYALFFQSNDELASLVISSGMPFAYLISWLKKHFKFKYLSLIIITLLLITMILVGWPIILLRLFIHEIVGIIADKYNYYDKLGMEILILMFINPHFVYELGFVIPYTLTFFTSFKYKLNKKYLFTLIMISFQLYYFHEINLLELLIFSKVRFIYAIFYILLWVSLLFPLSWLIKVIELFIELFYLVSKYHLIISASVSIVWIIIYYLSVIKMFNQFTYKRLAMVIMLFGWLFIKPYINPFAKVVMLDVGQGNCMVIIKPHLKEVIMIDVMGSKNKNIPQDIIVPYLQSQQIKKIDKLIITHDDYDHSGGLEQLEALIKVNEVISDDSYQSDDFKSFRFDGEDINDQSIINYFSLYNHTFLCMGDLSSEYEAKLVNMYPNLKVDYLQVGHHGSNTSSSAFFLHRYHPKIALISCGRNNYYNHPANEVLQRLDNELITHFDTSKDGALTFYLSKYFSLMISANGKVVFL